jgi:hypothetical protein
VRCGGARADPKHGKASAIAAVAATLLFQVGETIRLRDIDPFAPIAVVVGGAMAFVVAIIVGHLFSIVRRSTPRAT